MKDSTKKKKKVFVWLKKNEYAEHKTKFLEKYGNLIMWQKQKLEK